MGLMISYLAWNSKYKILWHLSCLNISSWWECTMLLCWRSSKRPLEETEDMGAEWEGEKASATKTVSSWTPFLHEAKSTKSFTGFVFPLQMVRCTCFLLIGPGSGSCNSAGLHIRVLSAGPLPLAVCTGTGTGRGGHCWQHNRSKNTLCTGKSCIKFIYYNNHCIVFSPLTIWFLLEAYFPADTKQHEVYDFGAPEY